MKGFVHSTPVPQIYKAAATIAELVQERGQSIKELVFSKKYSRINTKGLYALIVETLQHESILCDIVRESKILADGRMKPWLARVLITELLWGKKKLPPNDCKPIQAVLDLQPEFLAILKKAVLDGTHENAPRADKGASKPRYVRVNTLKMSVEEAVAAFESEGWTQGWPADKGYAGYLAKLADIGETEFVQDFHVAEVFAFPPRTEFFGHDLYKSGMLVLQDKATCLAPMLLAPPPGSVVLDMCAAPGLKTTQLAAIMQNTGTLMAAEKSQPRHRTLVEFCAAHGATVSAIHADATTLTSATCGAVEFVLVDPSCSGSGMQRHTGHAPFDAERVRKLAGFQVILLERALTKFPSARRVVYSTCSTHVEENEQVVEKVLASVNVDPARPAFALADPLPAGAWLSRGDERYSCGAKCLYAREDVDLTTGFFLAVFERVGEVGEVGEFGGGGRKRIRGKKMRELAHGQTNDGGMPAEGHDGEANGKRVRIRGKKLKGLELVTDDTEDGDLSVEGGMENLEGIDGDEVNGKRKRFRGKKIKDLEHVTDDTVDTDFVVEGGMENCDEVIGKRKRICGKKMRALMHKKDGGCSVEGEESNFNGAVDELEAAVCSEGLEERLNDRELKKKKKRKRKEEEVVGDEEVEKDEKKKKRKRDTGTEGEALEGGDPEERRKEKKKKKKRDKSERGAESGGDADVVDGKKRKKRKDAELET